MIQAIISKKAGRNISSSDVHWLDNFKYSEDSLTSTIWGLLSYLPPHDFWTVLTKACRKRGDELGNSYIESIDYWPYWEYNGESKTERVEPDIFIRTRDYDLIIEAKRHDENQQNPTQWQRELKGYLNQYSADKKTVYILAVGGYSAKLPSFVEVLEKTIKVYMCKWLWILQEVKSLLDNYLKAKDIPFEVVNILKDIVSGFAFHGYITGDFFSNTSFGEFVGINQDAINRLAILDENHQKQIYGLSRSLTVSESSINFFINKYGFE